MNYEIINLATYQVLIRAGQCDFICVLCFHARVPKNSLITVVGNSWARCFPLYKPHLSLLSAIHGFVSFIHPTSPSHYTLHSSVLKVLINTAHLTLLVVFRFMVRPVCLLVVTYLLNYRV